MTFKAGDTGVTPCARCEGSGSVMVPKPYWDCCGLSSSGECGGRGCVGPTENADWEQDVCPDCCGAGTADGSDPLDLLPPSTEVSNGR